LPVAHKEHEAVRAGSLDDAQPVLHVGCFVIEVGQPAVEVVGKRLLVADPKGNRERFGIEALCRIAQLPGPGYQRGFALAAGYEPHILGRSGRQARLVVQAALETTVERCRFRRPTHDNYQ